MKNESIKILAEKPSAIEAAMVLHNKIEIILWETDWNFLGTNGNMEMAIELKGELQRAYKKCNKLIIYHNMEQQNEIIISNCGS